MPAKTNPLASTHVTDENTKQQVQEIVFKKFKIYLYNIYIEFKKLEYLKIFLNVTDEKTASSRMKL